jgi:hypothetical protein
MSKAIHRMQLKPALRRVAGVAPFGRCLAPIGKKRLPLTRRILSFPILTTDFFFMAFLLYKKIIGSFISGLCHETAQ